MTKQDTAIAASVPGSAEWWNTSRRTYALSILCMIGILNFLDRQILAILLVPIQEEMQVSDTMMGLLSGLAFSSVYVLAGIPIARMADTGSRRTLLTICLAAWSLCTMLCGMAGNFLHLVLARIGVATGEAGGTPATQSMLSDLYSPANRGTVIGIWSASQSVGIAAGLFLGGWLNSVVGWRGAFIIVGAPGVLLAIVTILTLREPSRGMSEPVQAIHRGDAPTLSQAIRQAIGDPALRMLIFIAMASSLAGYSILSWGPAFYVRVHKMSTLEVGQYMGVAVAGGFFLANLLSGFLADRFSRGDLSTYMKVAGLGPTLALPAALTFILADDVTVSLTALFAANLLMTVWLAPTIAVAMSLSPPRSRGLISALMGFATTLVGMGLGPVIVGAINDVLTPTYGDLAIRYSLSIMSCSLLVCGLLCFAAVRPVRRASERLKLIATKTAAEADASRLSPASSPDQSINA